MAGEAGVFLEIEGFVEHIIFVCGFLGDLVDPLFIYIDVAGGAGAGAAAFGLYGEAVIADDFHEAPAFGGFELMGLSVLICDFDDHEVVLFRLRMG